MHPATLLLMQPNIIGGGMSEAQFKAVSTLIHG
jgi:hypothetical protein